MRRATPVLATLLAAVLAFSPLAADARAGGGGSFGSRGARTFSAPPSTRTAPSAAPFQRSLTPQSPSYAQPNRGYGSGYPRRSGFASGLMGGLIGAGIGGLLFGHGMFGGVSGFGGFFGFLIQILLIVLVGRWLLRRFMGNRPALAGNGMFARTGAGLGNAPPAMPMGGGGRPAGGPPLTLSPGDYTAFEQLLKAVQSAWSSADTRSLQMLATPEMVGVFAEQLADYSSRGERNTVTDVTLQQGDLSEAWSESGRDYATVAMRFSMIDVTRDTAGRVVDGSQTEHVTATELWTFLRAQAGRWVLSAIQQAR